MSVEIHAHARQRKLPLPIFLRLPWYCRRLTCYDRFTVTFDSANFVHIDDITVSVTGGSVPVVTKTRRRETDEPDTVEIVLDRPLTVGETTTFTLTDGVATNVIAYTLDFDDDGDGVFNTEDNCPTHANLHVAVCEVARQTGIGLDGIRSGARPAFLD